MQHSLDIFYITTGWNKRLTIIYVTMHQCHNSTWKQHSLLSCLERIQRRSAKYILNDYSTNYTNQGSKLSIYFQ